MRYFIGLTQGILFFILTMFYPSAGAYCGKPVNPNDPYERINRPVMQFNDTLDKWILTPVTKLYLIVVPKPIVKGVSNVFSNLDTVPTIANDVLQGNFYQATSDSWRLIINSTIGVLGFFDVASTMGLEPNTEDLGLTLARWGYKKSNYIVLPFFGPSTFRDAVVLPINYQFFTVYPYLYPVNYRYRLYALGVINHRANLLCFQNVLDQAALDKYVFVRDAYLQRRNYLIQRNTELSNPYCHKNKLEAEA